MTSTPPTPGKTGEKMWAYDRLAVRESMGDLFPGLVSYTRPKRRFHLIMKVDGEKVLIHGFKRLLKFLKYWRMHHD